MPSCGPPGRARPSIATETGPPQGFVDVPPVKGGFTTSAGTGACDQPPSRPFVLLPLGGRSNTLNLRQAQRARRTDQHQAESDVAVLPGMGPAAVPSRYAARRGPSHQCVYVDRAFARAPPNGYRLHTGYLNLHAIQSQRGQTRCKCLLGSARGRAIPGPGGNVSGGRPLDNSNLSQDPPSERPCTQIPSSMAPRTRRGASTKNQPPKRRPSKTCWTFLLLRTFRWQAASGRPAALTEAADRDSERQVGIPRHWADAALRDGRERG